MNHSHSLFCLFLYSLGCPFCLPYIFSCPSFPFLQVASMFVDVSSVLEECMELVSQCDELKPLLQYQKDLRQLDHNGKFLE